MKLLIDIGHPAHVHYFKNIYRLLSNRGHQFCIISREKEITFQLLDELKIPYIKRGKGGNNIISKILYIAKADYIILKEALKFKPDLLLSFSTIYPSHVSALINKPFIALTDTEHAGEQHMLFSPFSKYILTPECYKGYFGKKHIRFNSYMELCYLHPDYFTPDNNILNNLNVKPGEKYSIVRFVKWAASHDMGHSGLSLNHKREVVKTLEKFGKVFISAEGNLPPDLEKYRFPLSPSTMHSALAFANLLYGESATMASECSVLGTPSIFHDNDGRGYTFEQESKYGLVSNFKESEDTYQPALKRAVQILADDNSKNSAREASARLISEKINPTAFLCWFIENFPQSATEMKNNPQTQYLLS